jgi:2-C-methyl-D-erythritol 4-phosphate cytidylyltransferase
LSGYPFPDANGPLVTTVVLLLAAGEGNRLGQSVPKAFIPLGGRPILLHSVAAAMACPLVDHVLLVVSAEQILRAQEMIEGVDGSGRIAGVVAGGATRQGSVRCGLAALPADADLVLCHDTARPLASSDLFGRVIGAASSGAGGGAIPVIPSPDTVKRIDDGRVVETIARDSIVLVQTPQGFAIDALRKAHAAASAAGFEGTDDAMLLEAIGLPVAVVQGEAENFKITTPEDLRRAEAIVAARAISGGRERSGR